MEILWGKHFESQFTKLVQAYILPEKFNIDYRKSTYSTQICAGEVTREAVIDELQLKPYRYLDLTQEIEYFCKKLYRYFRTYFYGKAITTLFY